MKSTTRFLCISVLLMVMSIVMDGCARGRSHHHAQATSAINAARNTLDPAALGDRFTFKDKQFLVSSPSQPVWLADVKSGQGVNTAGKITLTLQGVTSHMYKAGKELLCVTADDGSAVVIGKVVHAHLYGHILARNVPESQHLTANTFTWTSTDDHVLLQRFHWVSGSSSLSADQGIFTTDLNNATYHGHVRMESHGVPR